MPIWELRCALENNEFKKQSSNTENEMSHENAALGEVTNSS
jgi:hypothetical protein